MPLLRRPAPTSATPDGKLLGRFLEDRDEAAFRRLYREHTPRLYALALRLTGGPADEAEELVQEGWVRAVERIDGFQGRSSFHTWLCGILVNCHRERIRRLARGPVALETIGEERLATAPAVVSRPRPVDRILVERAIRALPDGYREVLVLHDVNGWTHREIASRLEIEEGTSKSQLARARARLRDALRAPATGASDREERGRP